MLGDKATCPSTHLVSGNLWSASLPGWHKGARFSHRKYRKWLCFMRQACFGQLVA